MRLEKLRILIVDDNAIDREILCAYLKTLGVVNIHHAESVSNAKFKLTNAHKASVEIDLVICDWEMPKADGLELLQFIRRDARFKELGFFVMTATAANERVKSAILNKANDFIVKPIEREQLAQKLTAYVSTQA